MRIAVQMDHISGLNIESDTTLALWLEAQSRGYKLFQYLPDKITYHEGKLKAKGTFEELIQNFDQYKHTNIFLEKKTE